MLTSSRELHERARNIAYAIQQAQTPQNAILTTSNGRSSDESEGPFPESNATYLATHEWQFDISEDDGRGLALYFGSALIDGVSESGHSLEMSLAFNFGFEIDEPAIITFMPHTMVAGEITVLSLLNDGGSLLQHASIDLSDPGATTELTITAPGNYALLVQFGPQLSGELPIGPSLYTGREAAITWTMRPVPEPSASTLAIIGVVALVYRNRKRVCLRMVQLCDSL